VLFEILNEPNKTLTPELWNEYDTALLTGPVYASFQVAARRTAGGDAMGAEERRQAVGLRRKALDTLLVVCG
jgi:hypothetical protein